MVREERNIREKNHVEREIITWSFLRPVLISSRLRSWRADIAPQTVRRSTMRAVEPNMFLVTRQETL